MCRNITTLRGLTPPATPEEIEAAARQYVRKVSGVQSVSDSTRAAFDTAVAEVAAMDIGEGRSITVLKFPGEAVGTLELIHRPADGSVDIGTGFSHLVIQ